MSAIGVCGLVITVGLVISGAVLLHTRTGIVAKAAALLVVMTVFALPATLLAGNVFGQLSEAYLYGVFPLVMGVIVVVVSRLYGRWSNPRP